MSITIRPAKPEDLPVLKAFEQGIIQAERPFNHLLRPDPISYYDIGELITSPQAEVVVAEIDGELIASGFARTKTSPPHIGPDVYAYLGFMYVRPDHRGQGVNRRILDALLAWARSMNLTEVRLTVYPDNEPAVQAYEKAGFSPYLLEMRLGLDD